MESMVISSCSEEKSPMVRFPDPKQYLLLKQLEESNIIVSCDQLGDTLPAAPTNQLCLQLPITFSFFFFFFYPFMSIDPIEGYSIANVFFKKDKDRFTTQAIQRDLVPRRLRLLTVATGFAVARVTRVTGTSKRTCGIRASS